MLIDEMPAGRKMDKAVSQYVFGNTEFVCRNCEDDYHVVDRQDLTAYIPVPNYSTDIAAAWGVVAWMKDWQISIDWLIGEWQVVFNIDDDGEHYSLADTASLAICRAALKAMGVTEI